MPFVRHVSDKMSLQAEKLLTGALRIINPNVTGVRHDGSYDRINAFCETFQSTNSTANIVRLHKIDAKDGVKTTVYPREMFASILSGEWEARG
jgi:hypothetical protein